MKKPRFSIIIPAHNEEKVIERAIRSILNQTYQYFEIIISNDGSKDNTHEVVKRMIKNDKRIKILDKNKGHSAAFARNLGAKIAKGDIFVFLDADSFVNKEFLFEIEKKFKTIKGIDAVVTICLPLKENLMSKILSGFLATPFKLKLKEGKVYDKTNHLEVGTMFFCLTKKSYKSIRGYDEKIFYFEDEDFSKRFYEKGFKSTLSKGAIQYFELPATFKEFIRQCKWIGKGISNLKNKKEVRRRKIIWIIKSLFLISPLLFLWNFKFLLIILIGTLLTSYIGLLKRNKKPVLSLLTTPFLYLKTFLVTFYILRFSK